MRPNRIIPPDDVLTDLYVCQGKSSREIADMYNASRKTVTKHLGRLKLSQRKVVLEPITYDVVRYMAAKNDKTPSEIIQTVIDVLLDNHIEEVEKVLEVV